MAGRKWIPLVPFFLVSTDVIAGDSKQSRDRVPTEYNNSSSIPLELEKSILVTVHSWHPEELRVGISTE